MCVCLPFSMLNPSSVLLKWETDICRPKDSSQGCVPSLTSIVSNSKTLSKYSFYTPLLLFLGLPLAEVVQCCGMRTMISKATYWLWVILLIILICTLSNSGSSGVISIVVSNEGSGPVVESLESCSLDFTYGSIPLFTRRRVTGSVWVTIRVSSSSDRSEDHLLYEGRKFKFLLCHIMW